MVARARLIIPALAAATVAAAVTVASAATTTTPRHRGCVTPRLVGLTERAAEREAREAGCVVRLAGARLKRATIQRVAGQAPAPEARTVVVTLTLNPLCFGEALNGPPRNQGMRPGPTELLTGLYIVGGPALPYSTRHCTAKPGTPAAGTIDVLDPSGKLVASQMTARGQLATFQLAPGQYTVTGSVSGTGQPGAQIIGQPFTIRSGYTTRRYVIEPVP